LLSFLLTCQLYPTPPGDIGQGFKKDQKFEKDKRMRQKKL